MEGDFFALLVFYVCPALSRTVHPTINGCINYSHSDGLFVEANGKNRRFVQDVFNIGAREANRPLRKGVEIDRRINLLIASVHLEDRLTPSGIRKTDGDNAVKPARTEKGGIQDIVAVRRGDNQDAGVVFEAIHLNKELVQSLFAFIVAAAKACASLPTDSIDFIDEDDARRGLLRFPEEIPDTTGADTNEHFNEIRAGNTIERNASLTRNGFSKQGLACARIADKENAFRKASAVFGIFLRFFEIFDHFDHLGLLFVAACDIRETNLRSIFSPSGRFVEIHRLAVSAINGRVEHPEEEESQQKHQNELNDGWAPRIPPRSGIRIAVGKTGNREVFDIRIRDPFIGCPVRDTSPKHFVPRNALTQDVPIGADNRHFLRMAGFFGPLVNRENRLISNVIVVFVVISIARDRRR